MKSPRIPPSYRILFFLYPFEFRAAFQRDLARFLDLQRVERRYRLGALGTLRFWTDAVVDSLRTAVRLHLELLRSRMLGTSPTGPNQSGPTHRSRGMTMLGKFAQDLSFAIRSFGKQPAFTLIVVITVGLGVGVSTAMFSVFNGVLLTQLPYENPDELVIVWENDRMNNTEREGVSGPDYFDWLERQSAFEAMAAWTSRSPTLTGAGGDAERLSATLATHNLFATLGRQAAFGRVFVVDEDQPGGELVAVISHGLWATRFGSDSSIIGQFVDLDGRRHEIIGVMPLGFEFPSAETDAWVPLQYSAATSIRGRHDLVVVARLGPEATVETARVEMTEIMARLEQEYPDDNIGRGVTIDRLDFAEVGSVRPALVILMGAVGVVLLIVCANVANLLFAKSTAREREVAIRSALGARRSRILGQLLTESLLLALMGGAVGVALAYGGVKLLLALNPANLPRLHEVSIDSSVLGFSLLVTVVTGLIFGMLPAFQASRPNLTEALKEGNRSAAGGPGRSRIKRVLAVAEISMAFVLVVGAGLLTKSMWQLSRVDPGFRPENLATVRVNLPDSRYPTEGWPNAPTRVQFYSTIVENVGRYPNVSSVALAAYHPAQSGFTTRMMIEGGPTTVEEGLEEERIRPVGPGYFATIDASQIQGRDFNAFDRAAAPTVVIVNASFAGKYFRDESPIGKRVNFWGQWREIVGLVSDVKFMGIERESRPGVYAPLEQLPFNEFSIVVRGTGAPGDLITLVRSELGQLDPQLAPFGMDSFGTILSDSMAPQRFNMIMLATFAALALLLAALGIYGVISYGVSQRTHEFGLRMSLGAAPSDVIKLVLSQGLKLGAAGVAIGLVGALVVSRILASQLFGVEPTDPATFAAVALFLGGTAVLACVLPAQRASKVDPMVALRRE